ncbi:MAG TPA: FAD-dependent oxidoreductase [Vicinamibacteria bacterium]|nr:FAD-dependent oxidoreductase [Vicinamibacteria bacterium]
MGDRRDFVIVGAGVAGLTFADSVLAAGRSALVVERNDHVGGLARSFRYRDFVFDVGPKRFHTEDEQVLSFLLSVLGEDYIVVDRSSAVHLFGRYFPWPLDQRALVRLPLGVMLSAGFDLLRRKEARDERSFTEYTRSRYGDTLYRLFFKPYTEKFLRIPCEEVHVDWAKTGINRAVIDKRVKSESLIDLARNVLLPRPVVTKFIYPSHGGFGTFCEKLAARVREHGGEIRLRSTLTGLELRDGRVEEVTLDDGRRVRPGALVWSGNLLALARLLAQRPPSVRYLSTVLYNIEVNADVLQHRQWIYFGSHDTVISRVSITNEMAPYMAPSGKTGLCVEVTCFEGERVWRDPDSLVPEILDDLVRLRLVESSSAYGSVHVERVRDTYPIYDLDYRESFAAASRMVKPFRNLRLLGRTGAYWYNNSDHSMKMALLMAKHLLEGAPMKEKEALFGV